jgi:hypothetical protein
LPASPVPAATSSVAWATSIPTNTTSGLGRQPLPRWSTPALAQPC